MSFGLSFRSWIWTGLPDETISVEEEVWGGDEESELEQGGKTMELVEEWEGTETVREGSCMWISWLYSDIRGSEDSRWISNDAENMDYGTISGNKSWWTRSETDGSFENGKTVSWKTTFRVIDITRVSRSRTLYPLYPGGYLRKDTRCGSWREFMSIL